MKTRLSFLGVLSVILLLSALACLGLAQNEADIIDDFEDGNVDGWTTALNEGTTDIAAHKSDTPDDSAYYADVFFGGGAQNWQYVVLENPDFGKTWKANGRNALRIWIKNDPANGQFDRDERIQLQLRETEEGDRWSMQIGNRLNANPGWQQIVMPFNGLIPGGSNGNRLFELENVNQFRIYSRYNKVPIHLMIDRIEAITITQ